MLLADGHRPEWNDALLAHRRRHPGPRSFSTPAPGPAPSRALAPRADHVVASEACARAALDGLDPADAPPARLRSALLVRPGAALVVTLGPRGLAWDHEGAAGRLPAFRIDAVDTTGAGDAFHGAYALGLARGLPFAAVLRLASAAGALACARPGAWPALPGAAEIDAFLAAARA